VRLFNLINYFLAILLKNYGVSKMKFLKFFYFILLFLYFVNNSFAQDITFIPRDTLIQGNIGDEMIFYIDVTNISNIRQTVFVVRTLNDLPPDWYSALCFDVCFLSELDSVATTPEFGSSPLDPGETREMSLHITALNNDGTAHVQLQAGTFNNPNERIIENFTATTIPVSVDTESSSSSEYDLTQNYPNPFNPITVIEYKVSNTTLVSLKVYDIIGREVAVLVNESKQPGIYQVVFNGENIASGIYFYKVVAGDFSSVKKMILLK